METNEHKRYIFIPEDGYFLVDYLILFTFLIVFALGANSIIEHTFTENVFWILLLLIGLALATRCAYLYGRSYLFEDLGLRIVRSMWGKKFEHFIKYSDIQEAQETIPYQITLTLKNEKTVNLKCGTFRNKMQVLTLDGEVIETDRKIPELVLEQITREMTVSG